MKYEGLRDKHLNVFIGYGNKDKGDSEGDYYKLENNITKAFINTLQSLTKVQMILVVKSLFGIDVDENVEYKYYLQRSPKAEIIKMIPETNRIMFGFCPEGECWGLNGIDTKNEVEIRKTLEKEIREKNIQKEEDEIKEIIQLNIADVLKDIESIHNHGSIPDAWLLIYKEGIPIYVVAIENKLHKLDPYQIKNHIENGLFLSVGSEPVPYKKYSDIVEILSFDEYMTNSFKEYLTILGYLPVSDFSLACGSDSEIRQWLSIPFGEIITNKLNKEKFKIWKIDKRNSYTWRAHVSFDYLKEINISFKKDEIMLSLAFGPTQNSGKEMLKRIDIDKIISVCANDNLHQTFHLLYILGRNVGYSYIENWDIKDYVDYWKCNLHRFHKCTHDEAIELYKQMFSDGKIDSNKYIEVESRLGKKNPISVVPEIIVEPKWTYEEVTEWDIDEFAHVLEDKIISIIKAFSLI